MNAEPIAEMADGDGKKRRACVPGTINNFHLKGKKFKRIQKKDSPANSSAEDKLLRWVLGVGCWLERSKETVQKSHVTCACGHLLRC
eukprot:scaffold2818_cov133-Skeletonema_marinoi.AAC.8